MSTRCQDLVCVCVCVSGCYAQENKSVRGLWVLKLKGGSQERFLRDGLMKRP